MAHDRLDISPGMVDESGNALKFLQIVAAGVLGKPSDCIKAETKIMQTNNPA